MLLVIDVGNTHTVFAVYKGKELCGLWRCLTNPHRTGDEYAVWLIQLMSLSDLDVKNIEGAILACVVPTVLFHLKSLCRHHFDCSPLVVGEPNVILGMEPCVSRPNEVGADRLVNAIAAAERYRPPLIVIDFGTATTFDVIDENGRYIGGVIAPGVQLSLIALEQGTARLPLIDIKKPTAVIGKDTISCMESGIYWGFVGLIEGIAARIKQEYIAPMMTVGTGGLCSLFTDSLPLIEAYDQHLTLYGLRLIYERNQ